MENNNTEIINYPLEKVVKIIKNLCLIKKILPLIRTGNHDF